MSSRIPVVEKITKANDHVAELNRQQLDGHGVLGLNLMASPGAGKTSLIEATLPKLKERWRVGAIDGDIATSLDAERAAQAGATSVQINTGGACHLDAPMVSRGLEQLPLGDLDILFVENVGNLVCPAGFALGTHMNVLVASVTEGDDKPFKYPTTYRKIDILVVNKTDLLPHVQFDMNRFEQGVRTLSEGVQTFHLSCKTGEGIDPWIDWLNTQIAARRTPS